MLTLTIDIRAGDLRTKILNLDKAVSDNTTALGDME
jgi:hypothetical protein